MPTICVIGLAFLYWRRRGYPLVRTATRWLIADEQGFAQLHLPANWHEIAADSEGHPQARQTGRARYVALLSECKGDFADGVTRDVHSQITRGVLAANVRLVGMRGPTYRLVGGFEAVQYEFDALSGVAILTYLHTTVSGERAFHQIVGWAPRSQFDRPVFDRLLDGFSELSGPPPPPMPNDPLPVPVRERSSAYGVH